MLFVTMVPPAFMNNAGREWIGRQSSGRYACAQLSSHCTGPRPVQHRRERLAGHRGKLAINSLAVSPRSTSPLRHSKTQRRLLGL
jgi:hypothetical protein